MGCCYGSQQLPPYLRVYFSGRHTHKRHLKQNKKRDVKEQGRYYMSSNQETRVMNVNQCYSVYHSNLIFFSMLPSSVEKG